MARLRQLEVILFDCQATSPNPDTGQLLEVAWAIVRAGKVAGKVSPADSFRVELPEGVQVPPHVERVTGLGTSEREDAVPPSKVAEQLGALIGRLCLTNPGCPPVFVIHFARFETPYLKRLVPSIFADSELDPIIICSHEISRRLLVDLPRKGLRAVAGYLGHSVPELRRSAHHVEATCIIWTELVERLEAECGIRTLEELQRWMQQKVPATSRSRAYPMPKEGRSALPSGPGVYYMRRSNGDVLYVGKAGSLKSRVSSYFRKSTRHAEHILEMLSQARSVMFTPTHSALEAALLESDEIKNLSPPYNRALRSIRQPVFASLDLQSFERMPSRQHPLGPFPSTESVGPLCSLTRCLREVEGKAASEALDPSVLGLPDRYSPELECLLKGLDEFKSKHAVARWEGPAWFPVFKLGSELWLQKIEAGPAADNVEEEEPDDLPEPEAREWNPERVVSFVEGLMMRGAYLARRAQWLCSLSEASLSWRRGSSGRSAKRLLLMESGVPVWIDPRGQQGLPPVPAGYRKTRLERQRSFDAATYDRMVVLTAELRRLLARGCELSVRLGPRSLLSRRKVERVLEWV